MKLSCAVLGLLVSSPSYVETRRVATRKCPGSSIGSRLIRRSARWMIEFHRISYYKCLVVKTGHENHEIAGIGFRSIPKRTKRHWRWLRS